MSIKQKTSIQLFTTILFLLTISLLCSCSAKIKEYRDPQEVIEVKSGERFVIVLESNRTTGYEWQLAEPLDISVVELIKSQYFVSATEIFGAGGKENWTFKAVYEGSTSISFEYVRPWEKGVAPANEMAFKIFVQ